MLFSNEEELINTRADQTKLDKKLELAEWYVKITGASWERALDDVGVNPKKILDDSIAKSSSSDARRHAARNLGLWPGYQRGKHMRLHTLRIICCPFTLIDRMNKELSNHGFYPGRMDGIITSDSRSARFPEKMNGTEYYLLMARDIKEAWVVKEAVDPPAFVCASRPRLEWIQNEEFYCEKALELDRLVANLTSARCVGQIQQALEANDKYLRDLTKVEKEIQLYKDSA